MTNLKLAVFAEQLGADPKSENYIAQALLLHDTKNDKLVCEIHVGKLITRFNPNQNYFLEDLLWQLNIYCQIPAIEIESDVHYPDPISIEDEFDNEDCMIAREELHQQLIASDFRFHVINWSSIGLHEKVNYLKSLGVNIQAVEIKRD